MLQNILILSGLASLVSAWDCIPRDYGKWGGSVCVCNATYCDDTDPVFIRQNQYAIYTSSLSGLRFDLTKHDFHDGQGITSDLIFTINPNKTYQTVQGFGAAFTDSAGLNIASLTAETQYRLLESYFSKRGNSYTLGRIPIGGTDFSNRPYTYADHVQDPTLLNFQLQPEDFNHKIPFIKLAQEITNGSIRFLAAAWTAPPWMKTNNDYVGVGKLKEQYYSTWSDYHIRFLEEYNQHGIQIWALSTGNEPLNGRIPGFSFNCMGWIPADQRLWVSEYLGPALRQSRFNETVLMALDDQRFELPNWLDVLFEDGTATPYIDGVGIHWYWDDVASINLLDKTHEQYPDKWILATEASYTKKIWETDVVHLGSWERGEQYAEDIINDLSHWVTGWVDWNLALDNHGGPTWANNVVDSAIIVNSTSDEFYKQPMFYAIGHFSKFVPVGSVRLELSGASEKVKGIAVITPDNFYAVILLNKEEIESVVRLEGLVQGNATFTMPAKSIITFLSSQVAVS